MKIILVLLLIFTKNDDLHLVRADKKLSYKFIALSLPVAVYAVLNNISRQKKFLQKAIFPMLHETTKHNDGSITETDLKKITTYYGLAVPAILGEAFCALQGRELTHDERWASSCQGAMTGLFDDFFDEQYLEDWAIESKINSHVDTATKKSNEILFDQFYSGALHHVPDKALMQQTLMDVYHAQVQSKKQKDEHIGEKEILDITLYKGGTSLLFYRSAFSPTATTAEEKLLYDLGGLMQLANDIFDVYKDRESGIKTIVTETDSIQKIIDLLQQKTAECFSDAYSIGFDQKNVKKFLNIISIGIFSRCFVCLDQLKKNEPLTGNKFCVQQYERKDLICDMDTKKNMLRSAAYHIKLIR